MFNACVNGNCDNCRRRVEKQKIAQWNRRGNSISNPTSRTIEPNKRTAAAEYSAVDAKINKNITQ